MLVLLGEVGGTEEYRVCEAIKNGIITKPIVAWCIGTCADMFSTDVQVSISKHVPRKLASYMPLQILS